MHSSPEVAIIGGGVGGLTLAQGLTGAGVNVRLYERDTSPRNRDQGYRIHINAAGDQALRETLSAEARRRAVDTASEPGDLLSGFDSQLNVTFAQHFPPGDRESISVVDRYSLRRALMTGLDDVIRFGREFVDYTETDDGRVRIRFADGSSTVADVLVGADGVSSLVRSRLLPEFSVLDIGVRCLYGKMPLTDETRAIVPPAFLRGFCFAIDGAGRGAGFAPVMFRTPPEEGGDYLMVVLTGTNEVLGHSDEELFKMTPTDLWAVVSRLTESWHPSVREVVAHADPNAAFPITLRTCTRIEPWPTGRVTLLGDAIHPMTPAAGSGANTALWDAALLTRQLSQVKSGAASLPEALAAYEKAMIDHGMESVTESLRNAERLFQIPSLTA